MIKSKFSQMVALSIFVHAILILLFSLTYKRPLVLTPKSMTVKFANINDVKVHNIIEEKTKTQPSSFKKFVKKTKEIITKKPKIAPKQEKSYDEIKKEKRENLEKLLDEMKEKDTSKNKKHLDSSKNNEPLLNAQDRPTEDSSKSSKQNNTENKKNVTGSRINLENPNRKLEYQPPPPQYPQWALDNGIQGTTKIRVWFDKEGFAIDTKIIQSSGNSRLDIVAKNYVLQFKYEPIAEDKEESGTIAVTFTI